MDFIISIVSFLIRNVLNNLDLVGMLLAFNVMSYLVRRKARAEGLLSQGLLDLPLWLAFGGVIGARLAYVAPDLGRLVGHPVDILRINGGMYFYGAAAGILVTGLWLSRRSRLDFWRTADVYALYAPLALSLFRWSCLLTNECFGRLAGPPLGIRFPGLTLPRYPAELYEAALLMGLFGVLMAVYGRRPKPGATLASFAMGYGLIRSLVDLTRIDYGSRWGASDVFISLGVVLVASMLLVYLLRRKKGSASQIRPTPSADRRIAESNG